MDRYTLILYIDNDRIIPVIEDENEILMRYPDEVEPYRWLYFHEDINTTDVFYGEKYSRPYKLGKPGYYGSYWENIDQKKRISIHGVQIDYVKLVEVCGLIEDLKEWFSGYDNTGEIPVAAVFADSISIHARKAFLDLLQAHSFRITSFSFPVSSLLAEYTMASGYVKSEFGSRVISIVSSGDKVIMSSLMALENGFVESDNIDFSYGGEDPVKMALVRHIIDTNNQENNFFRQDQLEKEYTYQMQFADEWLRKVSSVSENESFMVEYHLSIEPDTTYSLNIKKSFILMKQKELSENITLQIDRYCKRTSSVNVMQYIFSGDLFASQDMFDICTRDIRTKSQFIGYYDIPNVLHHFYTKMYKGNEESYSDFSSVMNEKLKLRESAASWLALADKILKMKERVKDTLEQMSLNLGNLNKNYDDVVAKVNLALEHSKFDDADSILDSIENKFSTLDKFVRIDIRNLLTDNQRFSVEYQRVVNYPVARKVIDQMNEHVASLKKQMDQFNVLVDTKNKMRAFIKFLDDNYEKYLDLKTKLKTAKTISQQRDLVLQMKEITRELLPEIIDPRTQVVKGSIFPSLEIEKKMFGLKKVPTKLNLKIRLGERPLPYACVVMVSNNPIINVDKSLPHLELPRGTKGDIEYSFTLPFKSFPKAEIFYIKAKIDDEKEEYIDYSMVSINETYLSIKDELK